MHAGNFRAARPVFRLQVGLMHNLHIIPLPFPISQKFDIADEHNQDVSFQRASGGSWVCKP
jgi:hypothetical protein